MPRHQRCQARQVPASPWPTMVHGSAGAFTGNQVGIRVGPGGIVSLGIGKQVAVKVGLEFGALVFGQAGEQGLVERAGDFHHHVECQLASFAGFLDLLVVELFFRAGDQLVIADGPLGHQDIEGLVAVVAREVLHVGAV